MATTTIRRTDITEQPYETSTVKEFGDGCVTCVDGWTLGCDTEGRAYPPGSLMELWGRGFGYTVRGLAIDGHVFWYRTEDEQRAHDEERQRKSDQDRRDRFMNVDKPELDFAYDSLPDTFKARIDKFRRTNTDFRWQFESYEMMCCTDALKIARYCSVNRIATPDDGHEPTAAENVLAFQKLPWEEQKPAGVDTGHSGNSFGFAVRLAYLWVTDPGMVEHEHGALTPLVGCVEYGCPHPESLTGDDK